MRKFSGKRIWLKINRFLRLNEMSPFLRRLIVGVVGGTILLIGLALIVLPGPAFVVVPLGLAILATEFAWAKRCVRKAKDLWQGAKQQTAGK